MTANSSIIPPNDPDKTRMDIMLAQTARAMVDNPRLFEEKTINLGPKPPTLPETIGEDRTVPDLTKKFRNRVEEALPAAPAAEVEEEISVTVELPLELLIQLEKLTGDDVETLFKYLQADPVDPRVWTFVRKIAPNFIDGLVVRMNLPQLTPDLLDSILVIGSHEVTVTDELTGEIETFYLYGGYSVAEGGLGEVAEVSYVEKNRNNFQLKHSLIKVPLVETLRRNLDYFFVLEANVGKKLRRLADLNPYEPRLKHILIPEIIADTFMVIPRITNEKAESQTLYEALSEENLSLTRFARTLSGMASGLSFLSEHDIIAIDNKDSNYMESADRGCLIDLGGFLPMDTLETGEVYIGKLTDGSDCPLLRSTNHNIPFTPYYSNNQLMSQELKGEIPNDITHKLTMARVIEKYLTTYVKKAENLDQWKEFGRKSAQEKLDHPPIDLSGIELSPAERRLYQLYLGLYNGHKHPYQYHQDDPEQGIDPQYLSLSMAEEILLEISKM